MKPPHTYTRKKNLSDHTKGSKFYGPLTERARSGVPLLLTHEVRMEGMGKGPAGFPWLQTVKAGAGAVGHWQSEGRV